MWGAPTPPMSLEPTDTCVPRPSSAALPGYVNAVGGRHSPHPHQHAGGRRLNPHPTAQAPCLAMGTLTALWGGSVCQVGNLFGKYRSIIITLYNGAFDSSSAIFLIIKVGMG